MREGQKLLMHNDSVGQPNIKQKAIEFGDAA